MADEFEEDYHTDEMLTLSHRCLTTNEIIISHFSVNHHTHWIFRMHEITKKKNTSELLPAQKISTKMLFLTLN